MTGNPEKRIQVQYYAALREARGCAIETLQTRAGSPGALYAELREKFGLPVPVEMLKVAVNEAFAGMNQPLRDGDVVVYIPPVAGG